jgi:predicted nuclease of restriction endonuclease-like (RecB) superfamily
MLESWIESALYSRQGKAITNFKKTLPDQQSDLAEQTLKDPYNFSFLALDKKYRENELEQGLMDHLQKFLEVRGMELHLEQKNT